MAGGMAGLILAGCPAAGCGVYFGYAVAAVPAWGWPLLTGLYLGGVVAVARLLFLSGWTTDVDRTEPIRRGGSLALGIIWPLWVPARYAGLSAAWCWRQLVHVVLGDLSRG